MLGQITRHYNERRELKEELARTRGSLTRTRVYFGAALTAALFANGVLGYRMFNSENKPEVNLPTPIIQYVEPAPNIQIPLPPFPENTGNENDNFAKKPTNSQLIQPYQNIPCPEGKHYIPNPNYPVPNNPKPEDRIKKDRTACLKNRAYFC